MILAVGIRAKFLSDAWKADLQSRENFCGFFL
jgi:hypothetical protein